MTLSVFPKPNSFIVSTLILIATSCCCCFSGSYAADNPAEALAKAYLCFNDRFIYTAGCDKKYRLNESGNINVSPGATDLFCNGPCFEETQLMLDCVENLLSHFNFDNKATVEDIRKALNSGCSYTSQRGNFNVWRYISEGGTSLINNRAQKVLTFNGYTATLAMLTGSFLLIW